MIYTGSHSCFEFTRNTVDISGNRGCSVNYYGKCYPKLAPKKVFWMTFNNNIDVVSFEDNVRFYIMEYWKQVLSKLDPLEVYNDLDGLVLLCYEKNDEFCHRHIVAEWFEILLNVHVPEVIFDNGEFIEVERPKYIRKYLDEAMRTDRDMKGFSSLMALYYFERAEALEKKIESYHFKNVSCVSLKSEAISLRCYADMIEDDYCHHKKLFRVFGGNYEFRKKS